MKAATARAEILSRMPELHRMLRARSDPDVMDYEEFCSLEIDFLLVAIWMFGDRELVLDHFKQIGFEKVIIRDDYDDLSDDLSKAFQDDQWLVCAESLADHVPGLADGNGLHFELSIGCKRTMQLASVFLDRVKIIFTLKVHLHGFNPSRASTVKFMEAMHTLGPFYDLHLEGMTDRNAFWSKMLQYAFTNPPQELLELEDAQGSALVTSLRKKSVTKKPVRIRHLCLDDCIIGDELFTLLLSMPIVRFEFKDHCSIRGDFASIGDALASNTTSQQLTIKCNEVCSSFIVTFANGLANNATLQELKISSGGPFSTLCRGVGRNGSIRRAELPVSSPMDKTCMLDRIFRNVYMNENGDFCLRQRLQVFLF